MTVRNVDVALNIFAKPYQTSLSVLSLLRLSGGHVDRVYLQFEPSGSMYDTVPPYVIADWLRETIGSRCVVFQPSYWLKADPVDKARLERDPEYLLSMRYQSAFSHTDKKFLFLMHNDVLIKADIIGAMLAAIDGAFAIGQIGQCWVCPAQVPDLVRQAGLGDTACTPETYRGFRPDFAALGRLYTASVRAGRLVRPYWEGWDAEYAEQAWPLPECRVNEWSCLVDVEQTRPHVIPHGPVPPFGAHEGCGTLCLDTGAAWFRGMSRLGLFVRHMDVAPYMRHWVGTGKMTRYRHQRAEDNAKAILEKGFPEFVRWCKGKKNGLFT